MNMLSRTLIAVALVAACRFDLPAGAGPDAAGGAGDAITPPDGAGPAGWLNPWARRKAITLRASQIEAPGDGALANLPVLVSLIDPQIRAAALATGQDIVFTAGDALTVLASEIESFNPASNELIAWVRVPSLSATADTRLYVYYGNPSPPAQTPEAVWTANYLAVWHLHQDPGPGGAGEIRDATSGNHDGTASAPMVAGDSVPARIGRGLGFNGIDEFVDFASMDFGNAFTISMWVQFTGGSGVKALIANSAGGNDTDGFRFFMNSAGTADRRILFETGNGITGGSAAARTNMNAINLNTFTHVAAVVDRAAATAIIYVDGVNVAIDTSIRNDFRTSSDFEIAQIEGAVLQFPGILDEIQVAGALRSREWLRTSFNNQSQPGSFHTLGPEELRP